MAEHWQYSRITHGTLELAFKTHGPETAPVVIALHGWRDNAASFDMLALLLPELRFIAPDFPGHGLSSWRHAESAYYIWNYVEDILALVDALDLQTFALLGHSMGGAVACLFAALFPDRVSSLMLLDAVGPLATAPQDSPGQMGRALQQQRTLQQRPRHYYPDFAAAVQARASRGLDSAAAIALGKRGIGHDEKGYYWTLDPRLSKANMLSLCEAQAEAFLKAIGCPALLVAAPGYWQERRQWFAQRCNCFSNLQVTELPGSHHQHMEQEAGQVATLIRQFLKG